MPFINNRKQHLSFSKGDWTNLIFDCFKFKRILEIVSVGDWFIHFKNIENKSLSQLYKPEASDPSTEDDCEESTEDLLESSVFFLRLKILPGRLRVDIIWMVSHNAIEIGNAWAALSFNEPSKLYLD